MEAPRKRRNQTLHTNVSAGPSTLHSLSLSPPTNNGHVPCARTISADDWTLEGILQQSSQFKPVKRIAASSSIAEIECAIRQHEASGEPLIIEGYHELPVWPREEFTADWLLQKYGKQPCSVRNMKNCIDRKMPLAEYVAYARAAPNLEELWYYKDAECPSEWRAMVNSNDIIPSILRPHGPADLFQHLSQQEAVESLMCYLGVANTFTPCHKDLCASSGQNIMCYTENGGSSFWFMTASADAPVVGVFFQEELQAEVDWESRLVMVEQFARAPFTTYIAQQKLGDLVLVPPRSCHQVVNHGGLTIKTSWSRMTIRGLTLALHHELPIYRRVCRPEQYRVKRIVYQSMLKSTQDLINALGEVKSVTKRQNSAFESMTKGCVDSIAEDLRALVGLYDFTLCEEYSQEHRALPNVSAVSSNGIFLPRSPSKRQPRPSARATKATACNFACDFCGGDIFQSFFECRDCAIPPADIAMHDKTDLSSPDAQGPGDGLIICPACYVEGRTCLCGSMHAAQCRPFPDLINARNKAVATLRQVGSSYRELKPWTDGNVPETDRIGIFEAGCFLVELRKKYSKVDGKCKFDHSSPRDHLLTCAPCHHAHCFKHLLGFGIHSAEAILLNRRGSTLLHRRHIRALAELRSGKAVVQQAEKAESVDRLRDRLAAIASNYPLCRSLNPAYTKLGWYDVVHELQDGEIGNDRNNVLLDVAARPAEELLSPEIPLPSDLEAEAIILEPSTTDDGSVPLPVSRDLDAMSPTSSLSSLSSLSPLQPRLAELESQSSTMLSVPVALPKHRVYVELPRWQKRALPSGADSGKKLKRRRKSGPRPVDEHTNLESDEEERRLQEDYAPSLARSLSNANAARPQFTEEPAALIQGRHIMTHSPELDTLPASMPAPSGRPGPNRSLRSSILDVVVDREEHTVIERTRTGASEVLTTTSGTPIEHANPSVSSFDLKNDSRSSASRQTTLLGKRGHPPGRSTKDKDNQQERQQPDRQPALLPPRSGKETVLSRTPQSGHRNHVEDSDATDALSECKSLLRKANDSIAELAEEVKILKKELHKSQHSHDVLQRQFQDEKAKRYALDQSHQHTKVQVLELKKQLEDEQRQRLLLEERVQQSTEGRLQLAENRIRSETETIGSPSSSLLDILRRVAEKAATAKTNEILILQQAQPAVRPSEDVPAATTNEMAMSIVKAFPAIVHFATQASSASFLPAENAALPQMVPLSRSAYPAGRHAGRNSYSRPSERSERDSRYRSNSRYYGRSRSPEPRRRRSPSPRYASPSSSSTDDSRSYSHRRDKRSYPLTRTTTSVSQVSAQRRSPLDGCDDVSRSNRSASPARGNDEPSDQNANPSREPSPSRDNTPTLPQIELPSVKNSNPSTPPDEQTMTMSFPALYGLQALDAQPTLAPFPAPRPFLFSHQAPESNEPMPIPVNDPGVEYPQQQQEQQFSDIFSRIGTSTEGQNYPTRGSRARRGGGPHRGRYDNPSWRPRSQHNPEQYRARGYRNQQQQHRPPGEQGRPMPE